MKKKVVSMLLACAMVVSALAGCGSKDTGASSDTGASTKAESNDTGSEDTGADAESDTDRKSVV